mmetsp:Transcript_4974/g.9360  ORF Transcript_4974/g.9360 Transcript_4974/m.9360 type:complete len:311 (+) Transcript_4974:92-1024(+)
MRRSVHFETFQDERICDSCYFDRLEKTIRHGLQEELDRADYELSKAREKSLVVKRELEEAKEEFNEAEAKYQEAEAEVVKRFRQYQEVLHKTRIEQRTLEETRDKLKEDVKSLQASLLEKNEEKSQAITDLTEVRIAHENKRKCVKDMRLRLADLKAQQESLVEAIDLKSVRKHKQEEISRMKASYKAICEEQQGMQEECQAIKQKIRDEAEEASIKDETVKKLHSELYRASFNTSPTDDSHSLGSLKRRIVKLQKHNYAVKTSGLLQIAQELNKELLKVRQETERLQSQLPVTPPKRSFAARLSMFRER